MWAIEFYISYIRRLTLGDHPDRTKTIPIQVCVVNPIVIGNTSMNNSLSL